MGSLFTSSYRYQYGSPYEQAAQQYGGQAQQTFKEQQGLAEALKAAMAGAGPSVAEQSLKQGTNRAIKQVASQIASQRGINPALAQRLAAESAAGMTQEAAGQGATLRAQEQLGARGQLGGLYGQMGSQSLAGMGQYLGAAQAAQQINAGIEAQNAANIAGIAGGVLQAGGAALGAGLGRPKPINQSKGGHIPGKAKVDGDSEENDTVPAMLSPGEIVIPRSKAKDPEKAKAFVDHVMKGHEGEDEVTYAHVLKAHNELKEKIEQLKQKMKGKK